tara:strand:+ start:512 stop:766 length:255 start_codon:yes stop_codon:yes gene_type:complete
MAFKMKSPFKLMGKKRKVKKSLQKQKEDIARKQKEFMYGKEGAYSKGSIDKMGVVAYQNKKRYGKLSPGELDKKAISKMSKLNK